MKKQKMRTYGQLKYFLNTLPEKELKKEVILSGEEIGYGVTGFDQIEEDYVQTDYGVEQASVQEYAPGDDPYPIVWKKGTPVIWID
jgi:hypothetical protein